MNDWSINELMDLHSELSRFVDEHVAGLKNNDGAHLEPYGKCDTKGTHFVGHIVNSNLLDFYQANKLLERIYGPGSRIVPEIAADGDYPITRIFVPLPLHKGKQSGILSQAGGVPDFQTLVTLTLMDVVFVGALYWKVAL